MSLRLGVSPIAWANDDMPELGGDTPVETVLSDAAAIGFAGVELGGRFPREATELGPLLAHHRLSLIGGWYATHLLVRTAEAEFEALRSHLSLLTAMGSPVFIAAECSNAIHGDRGRPIEDSPRLPATDWPWFGERMSAVAARVAAAGLRFAYHFHLGTVVERRDDLEAFLAHTTADVGLVVDTGHAALGGVDAAQLILSHPDRVAHVHAKDVRRGVFDTLRLRRGSFLDGVLAGMFTVPGDGDLDFDIVTRALGEVGYDGWIVIEAEQDPKRADPRAYSAVGLATIERSVVAAGLIPDPRGAPAGSA